MEHHRHIVVAGELGRSGGPVPCVLSAEGYSNVSYASGCDAVVALCSHLRVDLVLMRIGSAPEEGLCVLEKLASRLRAGELEIIVVTDGEAPESLLTAALALGARDFLRDPIDPTEVALRVRNRLTALALHGELRTRNLELQQAVKARCGELTAARREVLGHLAIATEFRDDETGEHTERVGRTAAAIAAGFGLDSDFVRMIRVAAPLHDVGKIGLPDRVLLKPGPLTAGERALMQTHTQIGAAILSNSDVPELQLAESIALSHHERWDGAGYPFALTGVSIPIPARIVAIADVFDALVFARPYKEAWPLPRALAEISALRGRHFDAGLVEAFMTLDHVHLMSRIAPGNQGDQRAFVHRAIADLQGRIEPPHPDRRRRLAACPPAGGAPVEQAVG